MCLARTRLTVAEWVSGRVRLRLRLRLRVRVRVGVRGRVEVRVRVRAGVAKGKCCLARSLPGHSL